MEGAELDDPRAFRAGHAALTEMRAVVEADPAVALDARHVHETLAELPVRVGEEPQTDRVQVASPLDVRARRFDAVFVCGLQEKEFPQGGSPDAFLPDTDRRELARASGLMLPLREDRLERERYLFYVCASRAERRLVLSSRTSDEEGNPQAPSFFVDDVRAVFGAPTTRTRSLAEVTWPLDRAPTEDEWERAVAHTGPRRQDPVVGPLALPAALEPLAAKSAVSAGALERFAGCPVSWLVDDVLDPEKLEPDPEAMVRGSYAHKVLEVTYKRLRDQTGERRVTPANLAAAERILLETLEAERGEFRLSPNQTRVRAAVRRLEFDLLRYLRHEAGRDGSFEPEYLELRFGFEDSEHPAVELADGTRVRGLIDRIDTWDGWALVRDYKSGKTEKYKVADWEKENRFQAALYMLVAERALGLKAAGGVYVPLGGTERRPRGMVAAELVEQLGTRLLRQRRGARSRLRRAHGVGTGLDRHHRRENAHRRPGFLPRQLCLARRLLAPLDLPGGDVSRRAEAQTERRSGEHRSDPFTDEQTRAIGRRDGSVLVSAGAGSGKTSVLVERFVQAVLEDGCAVDSILAITFTEKAAAQLTGRVRRRFLELGDEEHAREAEAAWISTIHGFCARLLRTHALAAGLDPEFRVLDALEAERLAIDAFDRALGDFVGGGEDPGRLALLAAYTPDKLADMVRTAYAHLRSQGQRSPRLPEMTPPRDTGQRQALAPAAAAALAELGSDDSATAQRVRPKLERCATVLEALGPDQVAEPAEVKPLGFKATAKVLQGPACEAYIEAHAAYLAFCSHYREHNDHVLVRELMALHHGHYAQLKRDRSGLDFDDLELVARDLLRAHEGVRDQYRDRFTHVMVDEFQDTNPLQNELLSLLARDNLFRVGDERQSIYGFRHADVKVFRRHLAEARAQGRAERMTVNFRSRGEVLDAVDLVFGGLWGDDFDALVERPGVRESAAAGRAVCGAAGDRPEQGPMGGALPARW